MNARTLALPAPLGPSQLTGCSGDRPRRAAVRVIYVAPPRCAWIAGHWHWTGDDDRVRVPGHCDRDWASAPTVRRGTERATVS